MSHRTQLNRRWMTVIAGFLVVAVAIVVVTVVNDRTASRSPVVRSAPLVEFSTVAATDADIRDRNIDFYAARAASDPASSSDRLAVAGLLFARSRTNGSVADLTRAEALARESVALRMQRNGQAFELLASVLMARHAFAEARAVALRADSLEPANPSHLALLGEIELELGDYAAAATHFGAIYYDRQQFTIGARLARWYEVTGRADMARLFLKNAITHVDERDDLPREQIAWFHYRLGELELRLGNFTAADSALQDGLRRNPDDVRVLGALSRLALARSDWSRAIEYGDRATGVQLDPTTLGAVSRAYAAQGDTAQATAYARAMSVSALKQPGVIHRAWGLFLLDHGTPSERAEVLARAERELRDRKDVYGHDLVAWALYRTGHGDEARRAMAMAVSQHTQDQMLVAHAAAIGVGVLPR
ncbi:tetratricopeptide repeat protein [Gemmatimonas sp.]|uniref:tetratricopeptide repeat protein n=1 Tax=Gemmatimonas sp. TaxID=1962908 RepID=UPI00286E2BEA|nr:tetratricopeptide repeat protein [Gemmatimonas sp.]